MHVRLVCVIAWQRYGLHANDVLARIQRYHDTRPGLKEEAAARAAEWQKTADMHLVRRQRLNTQVVEGHAAHHSRRRHAK